MCLNETLSDMFLNEKYKKYIDDYKNTSSTELVRFGEELVVSFIEVMKNGNL